VPDDQERFTTDTVIARLALSYKLRAARPSLIFRAIAEGWDQQRIVRELF
jgi:hypothetical protein